MTLFVNGLFLGKLEPNTTIGGCVDIFEAAFPDPVSTIDRIEQQNANSDSLLSWNTATVLPERNDKKIRDCLMVDLTQTALQGNSVAQDVHNQMYTLLVCSLAGYASRYNITGEPYYEHFQALKYKKNGHYTSHSDNGPSMNRLVSAIIYLNDDYEGGELEFPHHKVKIKPEAGMLILFPSNYAYAHIAHPVTSGTKYSLVTWIHDRKIE